MELSKEEALDIIRHSSFFDSAWYRARYRLTEGVDEAEHYLTFGADRCFYPSRKFSTMSFYAQNWDAWRRQENALVAYEQSVRAGEHPRVCSYDDDIETIRRSVLFQEDWYRRTYHLADDIDAAWHYLDGRLSATVKSASPYFFEKAVELELHLDGLTYHGFNMLIYVERTQHIESYLEEHVAPLFVN